VPRLLIVGGGCRGRRLAAGLTAEGHAVRITTRTAAARSAIEASGAECWIGTPDRLATLRGALDGVTIACWLLGAARGSREQVQELHTSRLRFFLGQAIDTTVRGFVYEAPASTVAPDVLPAGERIVHALCERNAIPVAFVRADPCDLDAWLSDAQRALDSLLARSR